MSARRFLPALLALCLVSCGESAVEVPDPDTAQMEPLVVRVIGSSREAALEDPDSPDAWGPLGGVFQAHGLTPEAQACYRQARSLDPDDFRWAYLQATLVAEGAGDPEEALTLFSEAESLRPDHAPLQTRRGRLLAHHGRHAAAEEAFRRAVEIDPDLALAWRGLGQALLATGKPREAVDPLTRAVALAAGDGAAHAALARAALQRTGRGEEARREAELARRLQPLGRLPDPVFERNVEAMGASARHWLGRARARLRRGDHAEALEDLATVASVRPDDPDVQYLFGVAYRSLGQNDRAIEVLGEVVETSPGHLASRVELAGALEDAGRAEEALLGYRQAHELAPDDPALIVLWAQALARRGDVDGVIEAYRLVLELTPDDPRAHLSLGVAWEQKGDAERAREHYERALQLDPGGPAAGRLAALEGS